MREVAEAFLMEVQRLPGSPEASVAHQAFGLTCLLQGDYPGARVHFEQALAASEPERDRHLASRFGYDPGVQAMLWLAGALWPTGHVERAANLLVKGLNLALQNRHTSTIRTALYTTCNFAIMQRKPRKLQRMLRLLSTSRVNTDFPFGWRGAPFISAGHAGAPANARVR